MNDAFLDKLKQKNISNHAEETRERVDEVWKSADKKSRQELLAFTGHGMYATISKIIKNGRITAKMAIILSRYLNVNPFYLIGESDERVNYSDELLKDFLAKLGYKKLWNEYSKHLEFNTIPTDEKDIEKEEIAETVEIMPEVIAAVEEEKHDTEEQFDNYIENEVKETDDISTETLNIMNKLTEDEIITLVKALLIRAKVQNSNSQQLADQIKLKLLLN